jgi:hypothetical protein
MKKIFAHSILFLLVGLPLAAAVHSLGLVRFGLANFPAIIAGVTVVGLLAILAADYAPRTPPPTPRRLAKRASQPSASRPAVPAEWTLHTLSV